MIGQAYFFKCDMFMVVVIAEGKDHRFYCQGQKRSGGLACSKKYIRRSDITVSLRYTLSEYSFATGNQHL